MSNLTTLPLLEKYIAAHGASPRFTVPFLNRKNKYNVELQNWADYQDLRQGIITIRQSGIRVKSPDCFPCLTHNPAIPIIYENGNYRYLNPAELLSLQSFPTDYQFPPNYSLTKIASLLGNSANVEVIKYFVKKFLPTAKKDLKFLDLFSGLGAFHLALREYGECVLALDKEKNCQVAYQLNFPTTPFLAQDIKQRGVSQQICRYDFDLLAAGFPCQPFSKANFDRTETSPELTSLLRIIRQKQPTYILLENVPNFLNGPGCNQLVKTLLGYSSHWEIINPKSLGVKQNRPRLFIWAAQRFPN